jgi:hypothetical protein
MPSYKPVDFDPFAPTARPRDVKLKPVDFDPFAKPKPKKKKEEEESFLSGVVPTLKGAVGNIISTSGQLLQQVSPYLGDSPTARLSGPLTALAGTLGRQTGQKITSKAEAELPEASRAERRKQQEFIRTAKPGTGSEVLAGIGRAAASYADIFRPELSGYAREFLPQTPEQAAPVLAKVQAPFQTRRGASEFIASQVPATLIPLGGGKAVQLVGKRFLPVAGRETAEAALARQVGIGVTATGGTINAASAGGQAYEDVLAKGGTQEEADRAFKIAAAGAGLVSGAASRMPGVEQLAFAEKPARGGILRSAGRAVIGEAPQEFVEEGGAQLATNVAKLGTAAETPIGEDVLSSGLLGAIGGATIAAPIGGLQGAFSGRDTGPTAPTSGAARPPRTPPPPPPPPADMEALARSLGPVGGKVTLQEPTGPQEYTFEGFDEDGGVVLSDADGVLFSEDPDQVQAAIKAGAAEPESGLGGMAFGMDITEGLPEVTAPPPPPPPPPAPVAAPVEKPKFTIEVPPPSAPAVEKPKFTIETEEETAAREAKAAIKSGAVAPPVFSPDVAPPIFSPPAGKPKFTIEMPPVAEEPELPPPPPERVRTVTTPGGSKVNTAFEVVDAKDLTAATGDLQNRDRSRASTDLQVQDIFSNFNPERLGESLESDRGSPIVGPDNTVESGNGRVMAINKVYDESPEKADAYRNFIEGQGFDTSGFERPVLVRRRIDRMTPDQRSKFVRESNMDTKLQLSTSEKAQTDAASLTPDVMGLMASPDVSASANQGFVRAFLSKLPTQEQAAFLDKDGRLSADGIRRLRTAVKSAAYGDADLINTLDESQDNNIKSIGGAFEDVAPAWRRMLDAIKEGEVEPEMDTTKQLVEAAKIVRDVRNKGMKIGDFLSQQDAFNPLNPITERFIRSFYNETLGRAAGREAIADALDKYVRRASEQTTSEGLFGRESMSPTAILDGILDERGRDKADLFNNGNGVTDNAQAMDVLLNGTPEQMRNAVAKAQEPNDKIIDEGADLQKDNRGCD